MQLAVLCIARGWDVVDYVRSVLGRPHSRVVLAHDIVSHPNVVWYTAKKSAKTECNAEAEYRRCVELVIQQELDGIDEKPILLSPSTGLPAWFRVVYPERPDIEIIDLWGDAAKAEFDAAQSRVELVKKLFPDKWERIKKMLWFYGKEGENGL